MGGGARVPAGAHREAAASVVGGQNLPWWIAGVAMFALIVFAGVRMVSPAGPGAPAAQPQPVAPFAGGAGTPPDLSTMTPREAADRLFDRVMTAVSAADSGQAQAFLPMALGAYEQAQPLDHDGLFHLSLLNRVAGNLEAALSNATQVLDVDPNHLLALTAAAEATAEMGRTEEAAEYYRHLLDVIDAEIARALPEYVAHEQIMGSVRTDATAFLAGR
jgi:tetratricopeptide (TPR) repeat protein